VYERAITNDVWWAGNWDNALKLEKTFEKGSHTIIIYGAENCCDGAA